MPSSAITVFQYADIPPKEKRRDNFSSMNESDIKLDSLLNSLSYLQKKKFKHFHYTLAQHFYLWKKRFGIVQCLYSAIKN